MNCPKCNYLMADTDLTCPRCALTAPPANKQPPSVESAPTQPLTTVEQILVIIGLAWSSWMLTTAAFTVQAYEWYGGMRFVVCLCCAGICYILTRKGWQALAVIFAAIALLFNPLLPVRANRDFWHPANISALAVCAITAALVAVNNIRRNQRLARIAKPRHFLMGLAVAGLFAAAALTMTLIHARANTALLSATTAEQTKAALDLGANVDTRDTLGTTPLMLAANSADNARVALLISKGASVNATDNTGNTALTYAAHGNAVDCAKLLLNAGADPNTPSAQGITPLMGAAYWGSDDYVEYLVSKSADVNATDYSGDAAASFANDDARINNILQTGAYHTDSPNASAIALLNQFSTKHGYDPWTPGIRARATAAMLTLNETNGSLDKTKAASVSPEQIQALLDSGADLNARYRDGSTMTEVAALAGNATCLRQLISKGANINTRDEDGYSPLTAAILTGSNECASILLSSGADVNATANDGETALMCAVSTGNLTCVSLLIAKGANVNAKDQHGAAVLNWAAAEEMAHLDHPQNYIAIFKALVAAGAK